MQDKGTDMSCSTEPPQRFSPFRNRLAQLPHGRTLSSALGEESVVDPFVFYGFRKNGFHEAVEVEMSGRGGEFEQDRAAGAGANGRRACHRGGRERNRARSHEFERRQQFAGLAAHQREQFGKWRGFRELQPGGRAADWQRREAQHGTRDDAKRSFASHEALFDVIAGIVLPKLAHIGDHGSIRQNGLDAEQQVACHAIPDHRQSPPCWCRY